MTLKALTLSSTNWKLVIKTIIMQVLIVALVVALFALCVSSTFNQIVDLLKEINISDHYNAIVDDILAEEFSAEAVANDITALIKSIMAALDNAKILFKSIIWANVGLLLAVSVYRYLLGFTDIPTVHHLTDFMETASSKPFIWYFFKDLGKSARFMLLQVVATMWLDALIIFGAIGSYLFFFASMGVFGAGLSIVLLLFAYSARQTLFAFFLPEVVRGEHGIAQSMKVSFQKVFNRFWQIMWPTIVILSITSVLTTVINYFLQDLIAFKFSWIGALLGAVINFYGFYILKCVNLVQYYENESKPYFVKKIKLDLPDNVSA